MTLPTNPTADQIAADVLERHAGRTYHFGSLLPHNVVLSLRIRELEAERDGLCDELRRLNDHADTLSGMLADQAVKGELLIAARERALIDAALAEPEKVR